MICPDKDSLLFRADFITLQPLGEANLRGNDVASTEKGLG